jgi:hypothetical protein
MNHQIEFDLLTEHLAELCQAEAGRARVAERPRSQTPTPFANGCALPPSCNAAAPRP